MIMDANKDLNKSFPSSTLLRHESSSSVAATIENDNDKGTKRPVVAEHKQTSRDMPTFAPSPSAFVTDDADDDAPTSVASNEEPTSATGDRKRVREDDMNAEELLEDRRSKNRLSAHHSRLRKRRQLKYMENQIHLLTESNKKLSTASQSLSRELAVSRAENAQLRLMQQDAVRIATALRFAQSGGGVGGGMFNPF